MTMLLHFRNFISDQVTISTILILGYFLAVFIFNPLVNICYLFNLIKKPKKDQTVPLWLRIANFIFLLLQIQYILFLNDTLHS